MKPLAADFLLPLLADSEIFLPPGAVEKILRHAEEMLRWNRAIRLTAITAPEEVAVKHILDSLLLVAFAPFPGRTLDFGSGAGYPGIPLAIALPEEHVVLLESSGKKCAFLSHVRAMLDLRNVEVVQGRLTGRNPLPLGRFEQIVTRATVPPGETAGLLIPYLLPGGRLLLMTGPGSAARRTERGGPVANGVESALPPGAVHGLRRRFTLPLGMGSREIREILGPAESPQEGGAVR
jgi:16S rRNA (guanine527-N7)-methyltransferase